MKCKSGMCTNKCYISRTRNMVTGEVEEQWYCNVCQHTYPVEKDPEKEKKESPKEEKKEHVCCGGKGSCGSKKEDETVLKLNQKELDDMLKDVEKTKLSLEQTEESMKRYSDQMNQLCIQLLELSKTIAEREKNKVKKLKVFKIREDAKIPKRENSSDAGMDLFWNEAGLPDWQDVSIMPGESVILGTGVAVEVPENTMIQIMNKGGIAAKKSLIVGSHVVDCGYSGEIFVNLHNIGEDKQNIRKGDKIAQMVVIPILIPELEVVENKEDLYKDMNKTRGDGKLGSTGVK